MPIFNERKEFDARMKWFDDVKTVGELRQTYHALMRKHHPDLGGDTETAKEINDQYDRLFALLSRQDAPNGKEYTYNTTEENEAFKDVLSRIIHINADIEIVGRWIWVFNGYEYREQLKAMGFKFASRKRAWTWHYGEYYHPLYREMQMDEIRQKYGSQQVKNHQKQRQIING